MTKSSYFGTLGKVRKITVKNTDTRTLVGHVLEALPSFRFKVALDDGREILAYASGRLRMNKIRILPGDKVTVEFSPYDQTKGRITYRGVKSNV